MLILLPFGIIRVRELVWKIWLGNAAQIVFGAVVLEEIRNWGTTGEEWMQSSSIHTLIEMDNYLLQYIGQLSVVAADAVEVGQF